MVDVSSAVPLRFRSSPESSIGVRLQKYLKLKYYRSRSQEIQLLLPSTKGHITEAGGNIRNVMIAISYYVAAMNVSQPTLVVGIVVSDLKIFGSQ